MPGQVINLNEWKAGHHPVVRCANAMIRCWWSWANLFCSPWYLKYRGIGIGVGFDLHRPETTI